MRLRFAVESYTSPAVSLTAQRVINARTVASKEGARTQTPVFRTPGIKAFVSFEEPVRGAVLVGTTLIVIAGDTVYRVSGSGSKTSIGTLPGVEQVKIAASATQAVAVTDGLGYVITSTTVTQISDADFGTAHGVVWTDGYFVFLGNNKVFSSEFNDPTAYDALAYDQLTWSTSQPVAIVTNTRDLIHFMPTATAVAYNKGTTPYPFALAPDGFIERGCIAPRSPVTLDQTVFWLADDRTVRALRGATPQKVSTETIEQLFATFTTLNDAYGIGINQAGTFTYVLTFPTEGRTFEYNVATGLWNERASNGLTYWQVEGHVEAYGKHLVWAGTRLGELDTATYTEWGDPISVVLTSDPIFAGVDWVHHDRLELDMDMGVGLITGQGSDPQIRLRYSDDGGKTWSAHYYRGVGAIGETKARAVYTRLSRSRNRVYELTYSDPTSFAFYGAYLNEEGALAA